MHHDQDDIDRLIADESFRCWALRTDAKHFEKWETTLQKDPRLQKLSEEAKSIILAIELPSQELSQDENNEHWTRLSNQIDTLGHPDGFKFAQSNGQDVHKKVGGDIFYWILRVAAIGTLLIVGALVLKDVFLNQISGALPEAKTTMERSTQSGQLLTLNLPDGSIIRLNSQSQIKIPDNYLSNRTVKLQGEAFFDVAKDIHHPFKVVTAQVQMEVLGTKFNVNAYSENDPKVSVTDGAVKVFEDADLSSVTLHKNEAVTFDTQDKSLVKSPFNGDDLLWRDGVLVFHDEDIKSIALKLERRFGVTVQLNSPELITGHFSAKYEKDGLENILKGISYVLKFDYEMGDKEVVITAKRKQS